LRRPLHPFILGDAPRTSAKKLEGREDEMGTSRRSAGRGWYDFAAVLFAIAGIWNGLAGLSAIFKKEYFSEQSLLYQNLQVWGWVWLIMGLLQLGAAAALVAGGGRGMGIALAAVSCVIQFASIGAYPLWSILVIALDIVVIYGLTAHGGRPASAFPEPAPRPADVSGLPRMG
jgi:hypothetical protein